MRKPWDNSGSRSNLQLWKVLRKSDTTPGTPWRHQKSHLFRKGREALYKDAMPQGLENGFRSRLTAGWAAERPRRGLPVAPEMRALCSVPEGSATPAATCPHAPHPPFFGPPRPPRRAALRGFSPLLAGSFPARRGAFAPLSGPSHAACALLIRPKP